MTDSPKEPTLPSARLTQLEHTAAQLRRVLVHAARFLTDGGQRSYKQAAGLLGIHHVTLSGWNRNVLLSEQASAKRAAMTRTPSAL